MAGTQDPEHGPRALKGTLGAGGGLGTQSRPHMHPSNREAPFRGSAGMNVATVRSLIFHAGEERWREDEKTMNFQFISQRRP